MCKDVKCLCGAIIEQVDLSKTDGWLKCPKCGCVTKPMVSVPTYRPTAIPEFDMQSLAAAFKVKKI
jgi:hypothetical protein